MRRPKNPSLISSQDAGGDAKSSGTRGVTQRSFLTNVATAGIAATASPLLRSSANYRFTGISCRLRSRRHRPCLAEN